MEVFKGLESYDVTDYRKFGGRDGDVKKLINSIESKNYTLIYGKSGIGKSSLLKAGIYLELVKRKYFPIYLRFNFSGASGFTAMKALKQDILNTLSSNFNDVPFFSASDSLRNYFTDVKLQGGLTRPLIIIDQFEELFTLGRQESNRKDVTEIIEAISDLAEDRGTSSPVDFKKKKKYHVILSMREDYLPQFHNLLGYFPTFNNNLFRLTYLKGEQAMKAIQKTAEAANISLDDNTAIAIIKQVIKEEDHEFIPHFTGPRSIELDNLTLENTWTHKGVTPLLLSFYCDRLEKIHSAEHIAFTALVQHNPLKQLMALHYKESMAGVSPIVRKAVETLLLTEGGQHRQRVHSSTFLGDLEKHKDDIEQLRKARILKTASPDGSAEYIELVHDVLIDVVKEHLDERLRKEQEQKEQTKLKELKDSFVKKQRKKDEKHQLEQELLKKEHKWTERVLLEKNSKKRISIWATSALLLFSVLLILQQLGQNRIETNMVMAYRANDLMSLASNYWVNVEPNAALNLGLASNEMAIKSGRFDQITLNKYQDDLRTIYAKTRTYQTIEQYDKIVYSLCLSKNGDVILSASETGHIRANGIDGERLWEMELPRTFKNRGAPVTALTISKSEDVFASGTTDGGLYLHDFRTGKIIDSFFNKGAWITDIEFVENDRYMICSSRKRAELFAFDRLSKNIKPTINFNGPNKHQGSIFAVEYSPESQLVYSCDDLGYLKCWRLNGAFERNITRMDTYYFQDIALADRGQQILLAATDGFVYEVNQNGEIKKKFHALADDPIASINLSEDEKYYVTSSYSGVTRLWYRNGELLQQYGTSSNLTTWNAIINPDNAMVITAGQNGRVKKWNTSGLLINRRLKKRSDSIEVTFENGTLQNFSLNCQNEALQFSLKEKKGGDTKVRTRGNRAVILAYPQDSSSAAILYLVDNGHDTIIGCIDLSVSNTPAIHPSKPIVTFVSDEDRMGYDWNYRENETLPSFQLHKGHPQAIALTYSDNGKMLIYGSRAAIVVYDCNGPTPVLDTVLKTSNYDSKYIESFGFSKNGRLLVAGSGDGKATLWDLDSYKELRSLETPSPDYGAISSSTISPDQSMILITYSSGYAFLFNTATGLPLQKLGEINQPDVDAYNGGFYPDGKSVYVQYENGITRTWEIRESMESFLERDEFDKLTKEQLVEYGLEGQ